MQATLDAVVLGGMLMRRRVVIVGASRTSKLVCSPQQEAVAMEVCGPSALVLRGLIVEGCSAGVLRALAATVVFSNVVFGNITSSNNGGVVSLSALSDLSVYSSTFSNVVRALRRAAAAPPPPLPPPSSHHDHYRHHHLLSSRTLCVALLVALRTGVCCAAVHYKRWRRHLRVGQRGARAVVEVC